MIISVQAIDPILVPQIKPTNRHLADKIEALVEERISGGENAEIENEIDQLVYELYGLTEEEITIVEESVN